MKPKLTIITTFAGCFVVTRFLVVMGLILFTRIIATAQVFPQIAIGEVGDGTYYRATIAVQNNINRQQSCQLQFYGLTPTIVGIGTNTAFPFNLPSGGWFYFALDPSRPLQTGYATLGCSSSVVSANLQYSFYNGDGIKLGEATVFLQDTYASPVSFIADQTENARVGIAIANLNASASSFTITAVDQSGASVSGPAFTMAAKTSIAKFLDELIPGSGTAGKITRVTIVNSTNAQVFSAVGLRFTGSVFSTIVPSVNPCASTPCLQ